MTYEFLKVEEAEGVATVRLARPEAHNTLSRKLRDEIEACLGELASNPEVGGVVLTSSGEEFSAGFDLKEAIETELASLRHRAVEFPMNLYGFPKPLVVAVGGRALAAGFDLVLAADRIVASERAIFGRPEVKFGAPPPLTPFLRKVGIERAKVFLFSGESFGCADASALGIVDLATAHEGLLPVAVREAKLLARSSHEVVRTMKRAALEWPPPGLESWVRRDAALFEEFLSRKDSLDRLRTYARKVGLL